MPVHGWTRVDDGIFHDFHVAWISSLRLSLNSGLLPSDYYALAEQVAFSIDPDVLTLQRPGRGNGNGPGLARAGDGGGVATLAPPQTTLTFRAEINEYTARQRSVVIRHTSNHRIVALLEILSPGNKASEYAFQSLLMKVGGALYRGIHVLLVDLHPPTPRDPRGVHAAVWETLRAGSYTPAPDRPLTLVSYEAAPVKMAYVEPLAVGQVLPEMPLFLEVGMHIQVPLEAIYQAAWAGTPAIYQKILEAPGQA
jgi:hypothetical protein